MKKIIYYFSALILIIISCKDKQKNELNKPKVIPPTNVEVIIATANSFENKLELSGNIIANDAIEVRPQISGRVVYLNIPEGKFVKAGTVLAKIYDEDLQAQLTKLKVQLDLANLNEKRQKQLLSINASNQSDYDFVANHIQSIYADIEYQKRLIDKTVIKAPFDGVAGLRKISLGAFVNPETNIVSFQSDKKLKVDFEIPSKYLKNIHLEKKIKLTVESNPNQMYATIYAIEPLVSSTSQNLKVRCRLEGNESVSIGDYCKINIDVNENKKGIFVPSEAIIPEANSKKLVVVKNGRAVYTPVETGFRTDRVVEIIKGISYGDSIIVVGTLSVRPNFPVIIKNVRKLNELIQ